MGRHRGLSLYWPSSDKVSVTTTCSLHRRGELGDLVASASGCRDVFICLRPSKSSAGLPGCTDGFEARAHHGRYVFLSVYVLLNLFLSSTWDWTLAERWLADKKEVGKVSFQHFIEACSAVAIPLPLLTQFCFGNTQGNDLVVWPPLCFLNAEVAYCSLSSISALNAFLKKTELSVSWLNAQHFFLDGRYRARWWRVRGQHIYHLQTRSTIIDTVICILKCSW